MYGSSIDKLVQIAKIWHFFWWRRNCPSNLIMMIMKLMMLMMMIPVTCKRQVASDLLANTIRSPSGERGAQTRIDKDGRNESQNHNFKKMQIEMRNFRIWKKIDSCNDNINMSHSQMLGKFEYTLPAKFWRLVGCTEMLSW